MLRIELKREADLALNGGVVSLRPGSNEVHEAAWEKACEHDLTRWYVEQGIVVLLVSVPTLDEVRRAGYSETAAHRIVAEQTALAAGRTPAEAEAAGRDAVEAIGAAPAGTPEVVATETKVQVSADGETWTDIGVGRPPDTAPSSPPDSETRPPATDRAADAAPRPGRRHRGR